MKRCDYCFQLTGEAQCPKCGSRSFDSESISQVVEGKPFYYNGYVVWWLEDWQSFTAEYLFYLGDRLVERLRVSREVLRAFVPKNCPAMPFMWDLFLVAQGEKEVLRIMEQNTVRPKVFEITVRPSQEEEYASGLTCAALHEAIVEGERRFVC